MDNRLNLYGLGVRGVLNKAAEGAGRTPAGSNIAPIARMGRPVRSWASRASEMLPDPNAEWGILGTKGNIAAGLAAGLKSGLGFYGAMKDAKAEQAYNDHLAQAAEQDRQDKLDQQNWEREYKTNELAQKSDLAQKQLDQQAMMAQNQLNAQAALKQQEIEAQNARAAQAREQALADRADQRAYEQTVYDRNRANTLADTQAANEAKAQAQQISDMNAVASKKLTPEKYDQWRENPQAYDIVTRSWYNPATWFGSKNYLKPKTAAQQNQVYSNLSNEDLLKGL